jgi:hypothetical protein
MRESRTYGSVRGALSNERPYRDLLTVRFGSQPASSTLVCLLPPGADMVGENFRLDTSAGPGRLASMGFRPWPCPAARERPDRTTGRPMGVAAAVAGTAWGPAAPLAAGGRPLCRGCCPRPVAMIASRERPKECWDLAPSPVVAGHSATLSASGECEPVGGQSKFPPGPLVSGARKVAVRTSRRNSEAMIAGQSPLKTIAPGATVAACPGGH